MALPRATLDRVPIAPAARRGSRININLRPLRPSGGTAAGINGVSRSRRFDVDGNVDIDIGVPTFINRGQGVGGINIPDTRATIDMTSRVPATSARRETTRTATTITGSGSNVAGSRIDPIDNTIDGAGLTVDSSTSSVKTNTIKKISREGIIDAGPIGTIRTTTTTTRRLAEAGITGESALSIENQLQAIEQQLVAAAGVDRPVFAVIPMNEKANQADFNEFLRNMTNANQVNIIDRKSSGSTSTRTIGSEMGVDNSLGTMAVDGVIGGGAGIDGPSTVSSSSRSSSSFQSSSTRTSSTGTNSGDMALADSGGTGGTRRVTKKTIIRRTSSTGNTGGADLGFGNTGGADLGLDGFGGNIDGSLSTSVGSDGMGGGSFTSSRIATSGSMDAGSGLIDAGLTGTTLTNTGASGSFSSGMGTDLSGSFSSDMGLGDSGSFSNDMGTGSSSSFSNDISGSFSNDANIFPTDIPSVNGVTSLPDPIGL